MNKFLPFMSGVYTTAPGLSPLSKGEVQKIFDIDETYNSYVSNKINCRDEDIHKYYCVSDLRTPTRDAVNELLITRMISEYPDVFTLKGDELKNERTGTSFSVNESDVAKAGYVSVYDALCSQLQEDIAVVQMDGERDWLTQIHLCSPNHWAPGSKIGRPFDHIHAPVPEIGRTVKNYQVMLRMIIDKDPFTRFAWGIATDARLNHHPDPPKGTDREIWRGRRIVDSNTEFYVRTERQNLLGIKSENAFIFTIRTYFYKITDFSNDERKALASAIASMTAKSLDYKGMSGFKNEVLAQIQ